MLRDDGLSYQDYLEQLTFLLLLKMANERAALTRTHRTRPSPQTVCPTSWYGAGDTYAGKRT